MKKALLLAPLISALTTISLPANGFTDAFQSSKKETKKVAKEVKPASKKAWSEVKNGSQKAWSDTKKVFKKK